MKKQPVLFERLKPFAVAFHQFQGEIDALLAQVPDSELDALVAECGQVTDSNCWWAVFAVAPLVRSLAEQRRQARGTRHGNAV